MSALSHVPPDPPPPHTHKALWRRTTPGFHGGGQGQCFIPITFAPNPARCVWKGPNITDLDCSTCSLGYEIASAGNTTCVQPQFRPYLGWQGSTERAELQLLGIDGNVPNGPDTATTILMANHTYTIPAPKLEPKERKFVGYEQPFVKIRYELDFSRGAEVDIGCGTSVVGDGSADKWIVKDAAGLAHPLSMYEFSYQWRYGRAKLNATPPDYGYFPGYCSRYHRFRVTKPGNFTFVRNYYCVCRHVRLPPCAHCRTLNHRPPARLGNGWGYSCNSGATRDLASTLFLQRRPD